VFLSVQKGVKAMPLVNDKDLAGVHQVPQVWTSASSNPGSTNDLAHGYQVGDVWVNKNTGAIFVCAANTTGAATWSAGPSTSTPTITGGTIDGATVGVTVPAVGAFTFVRGSLAVALTATGTTRTDALALTVQTNQVTVGATTTGVVLPASATVGVGGFCRVYNDVANSFHVYAAGSDTIDGTAGSTGKVLTNAFYCDYVVSAAGAFLSFRTAFARST
jgi:hypothetical protein